MSSRFYCQKQHRKGIEGHSVTNSGGALDCCYPRHLFGAANVSSMSPTPPHPVLALTTPTVLSLSLLDCVSHSAFLPATPTPIHIRLHWTRVLAMWQYGTQEVIYYEWILPGSQ